MYCDLTISLLNSKPVTLDEMKALTPILGGWQELSFFGTSITTTLPLGGLVKLGSWVIQFGSVKTYSTSRSQ